MESNTTKKNRKINRIRRKMFSAQRHQFAHMLNAQIRPDAFEMVFSENKKRLLEEKLKKGKDDTQQQRRPQSKYKAEPPSNSVGVESSPREYLESIGVTDKKDYYAWMKLFHPDKCGNSEKSTATCAKVISYAKQTRLI